jgi:hypothetical protein
MRKEAAIVCLMEVFQHSSERAEENHEKRHKKQPQFKVATN